MNAPHSIEIVGGGLAGLALGVALRRHAVPVVLHEAATYPRHRVCGEFIAGLDAATVEKLHLDDVLHDALRHGEVAWFFQDGATEVHRLPAPALGISRLRLDARLADAFVAAGGELRTRSRVTPLTSQSGRVLAIGRRRNIRSPWLGLKVHVRGLALQRDLEMHLGENSYVGLARVEDDVVNVCGLFPRRPVNARGAGVLLAQLSAAGLAGLAERIAAAHVDEDSFCAVAALEFDDRARAREGMRLGDAFATIPPFTGNGMAMAFQSAALALEPLIAFARGEASWDETCRVTTAALRGQFRVRLASAGAVHPFLLQPRRQRWFAALSRARLLPFRPLYAALH